MGRTITLDSIFDIDDVLPELEVEDIINWIDKHAMKYDKEKLRMHLTVHYKIPFATHEETLVDVLKTEAIENIWNDINLQDIEKLKKQ